MTKLIVDPIDPTQPGSYRARRAFMTFARKLEAVRQRSTNGQNGQEEGTSVLEMADLFDAMENLLLPRLSTDDGTSVEAVLDRLSAEEFDSLLSGVTFGAPEVPPATASNSSSPSAKGAKALRQTG
jgi:hypothetical protein